MTSEFFVTGGTLSPDAPSYVTRPADDELFQAVRQGKFCYVLTSRQMGKSSLMQRTAARLRQVGVWPVDIDLSAGGVSHTTPEAWYYGLLSKLTRQLKLKANLSAWWRENEQLDAASRFKDFLGEVVLAEIQQPIVIFIDEIDSTLSLPFRPDDFFATIRAMYNQRASEPKYNRLTFVLLGVARPQELIADERRTPFNIGEAINLQEFPADQANPLQAMLREAAPETGAALYEQVFAWTAGHPYLTQKICQEVVTAGEQEVDGVVARLFLAPELLKEEMNLQFIQNRLDINANKRKLLLLYQKVYKKQGVKNDDRDPLQNQLKLIGLVRATPNGLIVRNRIYERVFNVAWLKQNMPPDPLRFRKWGLAAAIATMVLTAILVVYQFRTTEEQQVQQYITTFEEETNPALRLDALVGLLTFSEGKYQTEAMNRFYSQSPITQTALISDSNLPERAQKLVTLAYPALRYQLWLTDSNTILLEAMQPYITDDYQQLELKNWVEGRQALEKGDYDTAESKYNLAMGANDKNPLLYVERGLVRLHSGNMETAMTDFNYVATHHLTMTGLIPYLLRLQHPELVTKSTELSRFLLPPDVGGTEGGKTPSPASGGTEGGSMALIPAGPFIMGSDASVGLAECKKRYYKPEYCTRDLFTDEQPVHTVYLTDYFIDKYEITNADYTACVKAKNCTPPQETKSYTRDKYYDNPEFAKYPVIYINWTQAKEYCEFAGKRLPTEAEWEKAARGMDGRIYPWGNESPSCDRLNYWPGDKACIGDTSPVGNYELGKSPYGVYDMAGNVWEWTSSKYRNYPYQADDGREDNVINSNNNKVLRGGGWNNLDFNSRAANRLDNNPTYSNNNVGSRCAQ